MPPFLSEEVLSKPFERRLFEDTSFPGRGGRLALPLLITFQPVLIVYPLLKLISDELADTFAHRSCCRSRLPACQAHRSEMCAEPKRLLPRLSEIFLHPCLRATLQRLLLPQQSEVL